MHWIQEAKTQWHVWKRWILIGAGLLAFFFLLRLFPTEYFSKHVAALCEWVASKGAWAPFILGLIDAVGVAICFPLTLAFELAAGFLFGVTAGYAFPSHDILLCPNHPLNPNTNHIGDTCGQHYRNFSGQSYRCRCCASTRAYPSQQLGSEHAKEQPTLL